MGELESQNKLILLEKNFNLLKKIINFFFYRIIF